MTTLPKPSGDALALVHEFVTASLEGRLSDGQLLAFEQSLRDRPEMMDAYLDYIEATLGLASVLEMATGGEATGIGAPIETASLHSPINGRAGTVAAPATVPLPPLSSPEILGGGGAANPLNASSDFGSPPRSGSSVFSSPWIVGLGLVAGLGALVVLVVVFVLPGALRRGQQGAPHSPAGDAATDKLIAKSPPVSPDGRAAPPVAAGSTISVAGDMPEVIRLTDGSQAELAPGASAVLHGRAGGVRQLIELVKGAGTFRVQKAHGDFRIVTKLGSVTAVGTEFSVRILLPQETAPDATSNRAEAPSHGALAVAVAEGTVKVEIGGKTFLLHHGESRVFGGNPVAMADQAEPAPSGKSLEINKTLEIKLRGTIRRSWDDVKLAHFAYGPKQEFDAATQETHIWLPYGRNGVYFEATGVKITDPGHGGSGSPQVTSVDGNTSGRLVFKLHFDNPIGNFRLFAGWSEWGVGHGTVGGIEYSVDGKKWITIRETDQAKIIEPFVDPNTFKATGLKARDLYIRCYSRDKEHPEADFGPNRWMHFRLGGDTAWGDASSTFFKAQMQLWVTAARADPPKNSP